MEKNKPEDNKNNRENKNKILLGILIAVLIIVLGVTAYLLFFNKDDSLDESKLSYTDLIKQVSDGEIEKIEMTVGSTSVKVKQKNVEEEKKSIVPNTQAFIELIQQKVAEGNNIELIQNPKNALVSISETFFTLLPTLMIVILFVLILKMQGLGDKGKIYDAETSKQKIKFDDVAGLDEEKQEMLEIV